MIPNGIIFKEITYSNDTIKYDFEQNTQSERGIKHCESLDSFNQIDVLSILNINIIHKNLKKNLLIPDYNIQE